MQEGLANGPGEQLPRLVRSISGSYIVLFVTAGEKLRLSLPFSFARHECARVEVWRF
jgi:hypothetical protein